MLDEKLKTNHSVDRKFFLKTIFLGITAIINPVDILFSKENGIVKSYTRISGPPTMRGDEFQSTRQSWVDVSRFTEAVDYFQRKGLILSFRKKDEVNSTEVSFVFASRKAKQNFDSYLAEKNIFIEKNILNLGLTHETGII